MNTDLDQHMRATFDEIVARTPAIGPAPTVVLQTDTEPTTHRSRLWLATAAASVVVLAAGGLLWSMTERDRPAPRTAAVLSAADPTAPDESAAPPFYEVARAEEYVTRAVIAQNRELREQLSDQAQPATATATMSAPFANTGASLVLVGDDIASRLCGPPSAGEQPSCTENRLVDGQFYSYVRSETRDDEVLPPRWYVHPNDDTTLRRHPTARTPFELLTAVSEQVPLLDDGTEIIGGEPTTRLVATDLGGFDDAILPLGGAPAVEVLELTLWIRGDGVVLRAEALVEMPVDPVDPDGRTVTDWWWVEFADIGDPMLTVEAPAGAVVSDALG